MPSSNKENLSVKSGSGFTQLVALFLAEVIRSRKTSISRAAEISTRVVAGINQVHNETEVLNLLSELEKDFEEVVALKQALHFGYKESETRVYEREIKEFAAALFAQDMVLSATFLQDAAQHGVTIQQLCLKYPSFCSFVINVSDKADMLKDYKTA